MCIRDRAHNLLRGRRLGLGDQYAGPRIVEQPRLAAEVRLQLCRPDGRVERDGYPAGEQGAEEVDEETPTGWQHDSHALTAPDPLGRQSGCSSTCHARASVSVLAATGHAPPGARVVTFSMGRSPRGPIG